MAVVLLAVHSAANLGRLLHLLIAAVNLSVVMRVAVVFVVKLEVMLPEYYALRGWDADGVPTPDRLAELGVGPVAAI